MTQVLEIERLPLGNGFVEWWRLNSPQTRNALTDELVQALRDHAARAQKDSQLRVVVLCGNGGHFCAGGSLGGFASSIGSPLPAGRRTRWFRSTASLVSCCSNWQSCPSC
jgi:isohexenylglutaconyl-CoA hydratase